MQQKQTFKMILAGLMVMLALLPFITTFNSVLTAIIDKFGMYQVLQDHIVPFESKLVVLIIRFLGVVAYIAPMGERASFYLLKGTEYLPVQLQWNCLGWQSLLLLGISFVVGLQGNFTFWSKVECVLIGFLGTFLTNIFRMVFISLGIYYVDTVFAFLIHDYFAALTTIAWLIFFWWFSYTYVLEDKMQMSGEEITEEKQLRFKRK